MFFQLRALSMGVDQAESDAVMFQQDLALHIRQYQQGYNKHGHDKAFRNRLGENLVSFIWRPVAVFRLAY